MNARAAQGVDFKGWKVIIGGSALNRSLYEAAKARGIQLTAAYGMSETCPLISCAYLNDELLAGSEGQQLDARGLKEHLKPFVEQGNINKWAIPSQIAVVTDIPKTSVGKLDKKRIRIEIAQWQEAGSAFLSTV